MVTRNSLSDVKCFNCGKLGHFRRHCPSNKSERDAVRDRFRSGVSAIHVVNELLLSMENEDENQSDPTMLNIIDYLEEFDELCKLPGACNSSDVNETIISYETNATKHIPAHFQLSSRHYCVHRLYWSDIGLKDFCRADNYPRKVVKAHPTFFSAIPQNMSTFSLSKSQ